jgi:uncharacterized membrane protein
MACACKVTQQLTYLQKKYGTNQPGNKKTDVRIRIKVFFVNLMNGIISLLLAPLMIISILILRKKPINITKVFGLKKK